MAENIKIVIDRAELDAILEQTRDALDDTKQAKTDVTNFLNNEGEEIKGAEQAGKHVIRMLPGLREAQRLQKSIGQLSEGNIMGAISLAFLILTILKQVQRLYEEHKRKQKQYEQDLMAAQGFNVRSEFKPYESQQKMAMKNSRNISR